ERLRFRWSELHVGRMLQGYAGEVLFVHDRDDRETRWTEAFELARDVHGARMVVTAGLGHRRVLASAPVASLVAAFVQTGETPELRGVPLARSCATPGCGRPVDGTHLLCGGCALDQHLFERESARRPVAASLS
ncbi:MAG TPA: alpha/beta hydrolase, partial [Vicinamibacteria bacterium]|nr:alpha/beta hydrolase [Vicinamibacteria bacterium]